MTSQTIAEIDLGALKHNLVIVRKTAPQAKVMAVIKANAYGHGMYEVAQALIDADAFAVARVAEAVELRDANIKCPIVVLAGFNCVSELTTCNELELDVVIHCEQQIELLNKANLDKPITVWMKINTGMNRLGFDPSDVASVIHRLELNSKIRQPFKVMTHLACADDMSSEATANQITLFDELVSDTTGEQSVTNSAGLLAWSYAQRHWVRPGIMLYGGSPFLNKAAEDDGLKPVMTLKSNILDIRCVKKGQSVGYSGTWTATKTCLIATIGIGYGDGYPRHASTGTPVLINKQNAYLVGRVSMDSITVDITECGDVCIGDDVILWGDGLPIEDVAKASDTISYDLMCGVTQRVPRRYIEVK
jgi:alanine racemase